mmetsp:Transcript_14094/g.32634  ORF Transcript_14094/g.32634 Transcript_14094/m.32634 type:complete len:533 (-) Transcript_14094:1075-2673(-)
MNSQFRNTMNRIVSRTMTAWIGGGGGRASSRFAKASWNAHKISHFSSSSSTSSSSAPVGNRLTELQRQGVLDEKGFVNYSTLHELQVHSCKAFPNNELFGTFRANKSGEGGNFEWLTYADFDQLVSKTRSLLEDLGVEEFSKVGIISNNRWEWAAITSAAHSLNASVVPMYEAQLPSDWTYILNDSGCTTLFCGPEDIFQQVQKEVLPSAPMVNAALCLDAELGEPHAFASALERSEANSSSIIKPTPDDLADLIYTSGTTGKPKGVELTHSNLASNALSSVHTMMSDPNSGIDPADRTLAFLPWAHSYGQTCELWSMMSRGASMGVCRGVPHILEDLQLVKPSLLFAVPTVYKRLYDGVHNTMESASPVRRTLMKRAFAIGRQHVNAKNGTRPPLALLERLQHWALDKLVLSKVRDRLGGNLRFAFVAGAACPVEVIDFMDNVGIKICEGYGLTETSPVICLNTPELRKPGFVGQPLSGVKVHIMMDGEEVPVGEEGEICCVGPNVMRGYFKNPAATEEVISVAPDGKSRM